jgi:ergothioneine biosynthesis protein EgtB
MADGGYQRPELWLSAGWDAVQANGWRAPLYWTETDGEWRVFTLLGEMPLERVQAAPVSQVSYFEADAYARWAGMRLPTEFEWEAAAEDRLLCGNLLDSGRLMPAAANDGGGIAQLFGDCWEWTASAYLGYPGFKPLPGSLGEYNGKFMSGQMVLRGGSCVTPAGHIRSSYRNFFAPETRWQFSGIRLASW